jgi:large subunit ribosomal protein L33
MAKKSSKKTYELKMMVPEDNKTDTGTRYYVKKPTKGEKRGIKLRIRKYDPVIKKHVWFVEKKMPKHSA